MLTNRLKLALTGALILTGASFSANPLKASAQQVTAFPCSSTSPGAFPAATLNCETISWGPATGANPVVITGIATAPPPGTPGGLTFTGYNVNIGGVNGSFLNLDPNNATLGAGGSSFNLNANGASFSNASGGPITVTGVSDGVNPFDAVNVRQLQAVSTGVASIAAMSNIPGLDATKKFSIGIGYGNFQGNSAMAVGVNGRLAPSVSAKASVGLPLSYGNASAGVGLSYAF